MMGPLSWESDLATAAHALGLGSCWIHRAYEEFAWPVAEFLRQLGLKGDYIGIGHVIGYRTNIRKRPHRSGRIFM